MRSIHVHRPSSAGRRLAVAAAVLVLAGVAPPADAASTFTCGGFAPASTACTTGVRTRTSLTLTHNVEGDFGFIGTLESTLTWTGGKRTFRCTYVGAGDRTCISSGEFPEVNYGFTHRCRSLVPGSVIPDINPDGIYGGVGSWQCSVTV